MLDGRQDLMDEGIAIPPVTKRREAPVINRKVTPKSLTAR